ncbi:hypothetical protein HanIR_Chr16g0835941 [Helianthus annuus]|nr:hypothetical protein HanIR_Chr16g0835941 [Helianthus annuus]
MQDMIENVLEIKDTHVKEVMTPLVDVVAIDSTATLVDFHHLWRVDNIVGVAYAMDLLELIKKLWEIWLTSLHISFNVNLEFSGEFRIRKVHMAVVLNEYRGTVGIVTLEDVVEEIVDENNSKVSF